MKYRVLYLRRMSVELFIDVDADSPEHAKARAEAVLASGDNALQDYPETYEDATEPTGDVRALEGDGDEQSVTDP